MEEMLLTRQIQERTALQSISYILPDEQLFFLTGYKVLQGQKKKGFITCAKVLHNGKVKLIYDTEGLISLRDIVPMMTPEMFATVVYYLIGSYLEIRNNGFIQCENVFIAPDRIYVNPDDLRTFLVYLPLNTQAPANSVSLFEDRLKKIVLDLLSECGNLRSAETLVIQDSLLLDTMTWEALWKTLQSGGHPIAKGLPSYPGLAHTAPGTGGGTYGAAKSTPLSMTNTARPEDGATQKRPPFFSKRAKGKGDLWGEPPAVNRSADGLPGGAMRLVLEGRNETESLTFAINKPEFILGKDAKAADGVIHANRFVSGVHCKVVREGDRYCVMDLGSLNRTYINGEALRPNEPYPIGAGDNVKLANVEFIVHMLPDA